MSWNYRLMIDEDDYLEIREVYYNKNGIPNGYGQAAKINGESIDEMKLVHARMAEAFDKPIIHMGKRFPNEVTNE